MMSRALYNFVIGFCLIIGPSAFVLAAPTETPVAPVGTTEIVFKIETNEALALQTSFQHSPPVLTIAFPPKTVASSLPERSIVGDGVIQSIEAQYEPSRFSSPDSFRLLRSR